MINSSVRETKLWLNGMVWIPLIRMNYAPRCNNTWNNGSNVALSCLSTVCIYPSAGWNLVSTIPNTHTCSFGRCPWWALEKRDSSTCTTAPVPQSTMGVRNSFVVHTSLKSLLHCITLTRDISSDEWTATTCLFKEKFTTSCFYSSTSTLTISVSPCVSIQWSIALCSLLKHHCRSTARTPHLSAKKICN